MQPSNGLESSINIVNKDTSANSWIIIGRKDKSLSSLANNHYSSIVTANTESCKCHQKLLINDQQQTCEKSNKIPECKQQQQPGTRNKQEKTNCCQFCYCFGCCDLDCCPAFSEMSFNSFPLSSSRMVTKKSKCMQNCCYNADEVCDSFYCGSVSERIQPTTPNIQHNTNSGTDHSIDHSQCQHNLRHYSQQRPNHRPSHYYYHCKHSGSLNNLNSILQSRLRLLWQTSSVIIAHLRTRNHPHSHHHHNSRKTRQKTHKKHTARLKNPIGPPNLNVTSGFVLFVLFLVFVFGLISCTVNATTDFATMQSDDGALLDRANGTSPTEGHQYRHRHSVPITIPNELITAESIYPCLDIFDVVLARSAIDRRLWLSSSHQSDPVVNGSPVSPTVVDHLPPSNQALPVSSNYDQIRQLIRVYWANKEVVDSIQSATAQHLSRKRLYPLLSSHHHHHHHHHHNHQIPNSRHPQQDPRKYHHLHPHQPRRPSMLIELRQLNYVREYVVPLKSQLVQMRCDQFEPGESLYYCFIRVILSGNAVQYESLPHCVPTMLNVPFNQTNSNSDLTSHHSRINNSQHQTSHSATSKFATNSGSSHSNSSPRDPNESTRKFINDSPLLNTDETKRETKTELNSQIRPTISILPPGPTFNNLASNSILKNTDNDIHLDKFATKNDVDIKQFALKSDGDEHPLQLEPQQHNQLSNKKRKVLEQTQFCHCGGGGESNENFQTKLQTNKQHNLVRINLTETETMVLHLIITSCSLVDREDYLSEDYNYNEDDYNGDVNYDNHNLNHHYSDDQNAAGRLINSKESTANVHLLNDRSKQSETKTKTRTAQSHALIESDIETSDNSLNQSKDNSINKQQQSSTGSNKRKNKKQNNRQTPQQHKKRRKNKKEKKVSHKLPENNQSSTTRAPGVTSSSSTTEIYPEVSSVRSTSPPVTSESSSALDPTICILSMDNPIDYSFKLDSIEPSYDFPLNRLNKAANGFQSTINLIDYLHKFPFLVVRNGQLSIDPRMNIENRSQTHYLRSGHLRLEAISSMNVTIRFRRSASPLFRPGSPPPPQPPPTGTLNQFKQTKQQQLGEVVSC